MFRNDEQRAAVCQAICTRTGLSTFWTDSGPTERAKQLLKDDGGPMSTGERIMFLVAWEIWNGHGKVLFADVADRLDANNLEAVGSLLVALGQDAEALDAWLLAQGEWASGAEDQSRPE